MSIIHDQTVPTSEHSLLGVIGGLSYHSTVIYYEKINQSFAKQFGAGRSAPLLLYSHDFGMILAAQEADDWQQVKQEIVGSAITLARASCHALLIASNTIHKLSAAIEKSSGRPLLHIADAVGKRLQGKRRIGLLGTRPTMEENFYRQRLEKNWGMDCVVPAKVERQQTHDMIFQELVCGHLASPRQLQWVDWCEAWFHRENLDALVMACTELNLLVKHFSQQIVILDSLEAHVEQVMDFYRAGKQKNA